MKARATNDAELRGPLEQVSVPFSGDVTFVQLAVDNVHASDTNPRGKHWRETLAELIDSVRKVGVLMPVLVRPLKGDDYELVSGHRRHAAAREAGLGTIPATVRTLTDVEVLEIQMIENVQRADLDPLHEAEGYARLLKAPGYTVERIAERIGMSAKYVYDRVKLLALGTDARALLLEEKITAGHAILLARLKPGDQARALRVGECLQRQALLFDPEAEGRSAGGPVERLKVVSVREMSDWIDKNVRFDPAKVDPMLFPETAAAIQDEPKVVAITHLHYIPDEARDGKTYFPSSWKRANGEGKSKICEHSTLGFVAVGPHRGEAYPVCIAKEKCATHWGAEIRERKKRATASATASAQPASGKKAPSAETVARKAAIDKAISASREKAFTLYEQAIGRAAGMASPEAFVRAMAMARIDDIGREARGAGETFKGGADLVKWISGGPIAQIQRCYAVVDLEFYEEIGASFRVDRKRIFAECEQDAREAARVQTSAKPAAAKKAKSPKKAKA